VISPARTRLLPLAASLALLTPALFAPGCRTGSPGPQPRPVAPAPVADTPTDAIATVRTLAPDAPGMAWWRTSMQTRDDRLAWWREARFGMFVHWGVYSALGGVWEGKPVPGYAEHIQRIRKIPRSTYRERVAGVFHPTDFDADAWVLAAKNAGMGYFVITAKHHDGFAMYDSAVSDYDVVDATPWHRDPMRALADAARRHGLKFGFYYSHAFDWGEKVGFGNDWEYGNPGGDRNLFGGRDWWLTAPQFLPQARRYVDEKAIPQLRELIANYAPDILWFDTPHKLPPQENLRILAAVRAAKPDIVVNGRIVQAIEGGPPARFGDYASTADRPSEFPPQPGDWEGIPTTNESYGWHQSDRSHKSVTTFVRLLAKSVARGGNVLLNIGPRGDGRIDGPDLAILEGLARWMKVNQPSIRGAGRTPLPVQAWGESTRRENTVYLHVFSWPKGRQLVVGGLKTAIKTAHLLSDPGHKALAVERLGPLDVAIRVPDQAPDPMDTVVVLELQDEPAVDDARLLSTAVTSDTLRAFDGQISAGLRFGAGKARDAWVHEWKKREESVRWPVRLREAARFAVAISYDAPPGVAAGRFEVTLGDRTLTGIVAPTPEKAVQLGEVQLAPGRFEIAVRATEITGQELFRLRSIELTPLP
jgi:alpha-L-fucosidase